MQSPPTSPNAERTTPNAPLKGWITTSYRTYKGKRLGPYHYRKWKVGRRTFKQYIKPADLEKTKAACQQNREEALLKRVEGRRWTRFVDNFDFLGRMNDKFDRNEEPREDQKHYIARLHHQGMFISGRPNYRLRRVFGAPHFSKPFPHIWRKYRDVWQGPYTLKHVVDAFQLECFNCQQKRRRRERNLILRLLQEVRREMHLTY